MQAATGTRAGSTAVRWRGVAQQVGEPGPHRVPPLGPEGHEVVERRPGGRAVQQPGEVAHAGSRQPVEVDDRVADAHTDPAPPVAGGHHAVGQVLGREPGAVGARHPRPQTRVTAGPHRQLAEGLVDRARADRRDQLAGAGDPARQVARVGLLGGQHRGHLADGGPRAGHRRGRQQVHEAMAGRLVPAGAEGVVQPGRGLELEAPLDASDQDLRQPLDGRHRVVGEPPAADLGPGPRLHDLVEGRPDGPAVG